MDFVILVTIIFACFNNNLESLFSLHFVFTADRSCFITACCTCWGVNSLKILDHVVPIFTILEVSTILALRICTESKQQRCCCQ